jgi:hypothetical protein
MASGSRSLPAGQLQKISVTGGAAICAVRRPDGRGGTWAERQHDHLHAQQRRPVLLRVPASGGTPPSFGRA